MDVDEYEHAHAHEYVDADGYVEAGMWQLPGVRGRSIHGVADQVAIL